MSCTFNPHFGDWEGGTSLNDLRIDEYEVVTSSNDSFAIYNTRELARVGAAVSIARTIFICFLLSIGSYFFNRDANVLVLEPIERMIERIKIISKNPLAIVTDEADKGMLAVTAKED